MDDFQFYPTPPELAARAWRLFRDRGFSRVLEAEAGDGSLADAFPENKSYSGRSSQSVVDCCEIDLARHATLRGKGYKVVGVDFLEFQQGSHYSHIIMNPPFANGVNHVLHAWDILWAGEIVAILNAETLRNPYSKERQRLAQLVDDFGSVEYLQGAFSDAEVSTNVEIALIWLKKSSESSSFLEGLFDELTTDTMTARGLAGSEQIGQEVALPASTIDNAVRIFDAAVRAMKAAVFAEARSSYYAGLLGRPFAELQNEGGNAESAKSLPDTIRSNLSSRYDELKDRAWGNILRSTEVSSRLSSKTQRELESQLEKLKSLEFTVSNIYGVLLGLVANQGKLQQEMALEVFDLITTYHSDNTVFYKGWKSNDKHRQCGWRLRSTRFILPGFSGYSYGHFNRQPGWDFLKRLSDIDKVFAMLDGKAKPDVSLEQLFSGSWDELAREGKRLAASYFEVRYYAKTGTIHFFAGGSSGEGKKLIDRLNRLVGGLRQWIPPSAGEAESAFWRQYEKAESFDKDLRSAVAATQRRQFGEPLRELMLATLGTDKDRFGREEQAARIGAVLQEVLEQKELDFERQLESDLDPEQKQLPLLAA